MLIFHKAVFEKPAYYEDTVSKRRYRRLAGGIGWPRRGVEGVGIVLTEDEDSPPNYRVLVGVFDYNVLTLIEKCKALEVEYPVQGWHCNPTDMAAMTLLYEFNKDNLVGNKLKVLGAPLAGEPNNSGYYLPTVIEMGKVGRERLSAGVVPLVKAALDAIMPDTHLNKDIGEFPPLAALCYPLAYLRVYKAIIPKPSKPDYKSYGEMSWQL